MRNRRAPIVIVVAAAAILLAGCASGASSDSSVEMPAGVSGEVAVGAPDAMPQEMAVDSKVGTVTTTVPTDRQVIKTAYLTMRAESVAATSAQVHALVRKSNGFIANEDSASNGDVTYSNITAQIPAADLDAFIAAVSALGTVDSVNVAAQDVTTQVVDLDARIKAMQASIDRMTVLMGQATKIDDLLAIETQISMRQAELDSMTAQRTYLSEQVAMSTITVAITPASQPAEVVDAPGFLSGLQSGWAAFVSVIVVAVTAIGFLLPFIVVLLLVLIPILYVAVRATRRRRRTVPSTGPVEPQVEPKERTDTSAGA